MVGSWYEQYKDMLIKLFKWEFDLIDFDFKVEEYLELGSDGGEKELEYTE